LVHAIVLIFRFECTEKYFSKWEKDCFELKEFKTIYFKNIQQKIKQITAGNPIIIIE